MELEISRYLGQNQNPEKQTYQMKTMTRILGNKASGFLLRICFVFLCVATIGACTKDPNTPPVVNDPLTVNSVTLNGRNLDIPITDTMMIGASFHLKWTSNADTVLLSVGTETFKKAGSGEFYSSPISVSTSISLTFIKKGSKSVVKSASIVAKSQTITKPKVTISVTPNPTDSGHIVTVTIAVIGTYDFVSCSEMPEVNKPGAYQKSVTETITFHASAGNSAGTDTSSTQVIVNPPPPLHPLQDKIILHPWSLDSGLSSCSGDENGQWIPGNVSQSDKDVRYVFYANGKWKAFRYGVEINHGDYTINESDSTMNWGGGIYLIQVLTPEIMTLKFQTLSIGCPNNQGWIKMTYLPSVVKK